MENLPLKELFSRYPYVRNYFSENKLEIANNEERSLRSLLDGFSGEDLENMALDKEFFIEDTRLFIARMEDLLGSRDKEEFETLTLLPGFDKNGRPESFSSLTARRSEVISVVGPTGSGKSCLLADIESAAGQDTPSGRSVLVNGQPAAGWRAGRRRKLVAQLSQNMNFVLDLTVEEFLRLHAESRYIDACGGVISRVLAEANRLSGESFRPDTPMTRLSGGQSRALMIADTAILCASPIILIDEIENAGVDRKKALELLIAEDKLVFLSTHDPLLALLAHKRLVIENGAVERILVTSPEEKTLLQELEQADGLLRDLRARLRRGERLELAGIKY
jgi:ABC-type lipoprotein export system ATPase subunit